MSRSVFDWIVAFAGTFGASLLRPGGADLGWNDTLGLGLQAFGIALGVCGYLTLRQSIGLVPAHRGLVTSGLYRLVRHPLYASYVVAELGYLVQSPRVWNALVLAVFWTCQIVRIDREERLLSADPAYRAYAAITRWRLIPGVW